MNLGRFRYSFVASQGRCHVFISTRSFHPHVLQGVQRRHLLPIHGLDGHGSRRRAAQPWNRRRFCRILRMGQHDTFTLHQHWLDLVQTKLNWKSLPCSRWNQHQSDAAMCNRLRSGTTGYRRTTNILALSTKLAVRNSSHLISRPVQMGSCPKKRRSLVME